MRSISRDIGRVLEPMQNSRLSLRGEHRKEDRAAVGVGIALESYMHTNLRSMVRIDTHLLTMGIAVSTPTSITQDPVNNLRGELREIGRTDPSHPKNRHHLEIHTIVRTPLSSTATLRSSIVWDVMQELGRKKRCTEKHTYKDT
jgi:hypothetical protein